ncbi:MAG: sel1 repeat family protein [Puniceicoccaceae bacterium]|nr:MAG: sel1 repeat family protein [Puniceicoccaceae bacterium]
MHRRHIFNHLILGISFVLGLCLPIQTSAAEPEALDPGVLVYLDSKSILADASVPGHEAILRAFDRSNPGDIRNEAFEYALEAEHPLALYLLAGNTKNQDKRLDLFARAARGGYRPAAFKIGHTLYRHGRGNEADFSQALAAFYPAAEAGEPSAQFYLGRMYQLGHGTEIDGAKAAKWYIRAGENGQARAWNNLGNVYADGLVGPKDTETILACYKKASEMGMAMGSYNVGGVYHYGKHGIERDAAKAEHYYRLTLEQYPDYPGAWNHLGNVLRRGGTNLEPDYLAAEDAFKQGVRLGDLHAMYNLADLYFTGTLPAEAERIVELLQQASDQNYTLANRRLGFMYENGRFVTQDTEKALHHYNLAAEAGNAFAQNALAVLLVRARLEAADAPRVIDLLEASAKSGNWNAMSNLGFRIAYGRVAGEAPSRGVELLEAAANRGLVVAIGHLAEISENPDYQHLLSSEQREQWIAERGRLRAEAKQAASLSLSEVAPLLEAAEWEMALLQVEEAFNDWNRSYKDVNSYLERLWWDAQTQQGRINPEWSVVLYEWLDRSYSQFVSGAKLTRLIVCRNRSSALLRTGQLVQHRALARRTEALLQEVEGIDVRQLLADFRSGSLEALPLNYGPDWASFLAPQTKPGNGMSYAVMLAFLTLVSEHVNQTEWQEAVILLDWVDRWADAAAKGEIVPFSTNLGHIQDVSARARFLRAGIEEIRGNGEGALAIYDSLIAEAPEIYRARDFHRAIAQRALLQVSLGRWEQIDLERLYAVEQLQADNHFVSLAAPEFTKLARAEALHGQSFRELGFALAFEVIQSKEGKERPFLRLQALEALIRMALLERRYFHDSPHMDEVEAWLVEALALIRDKGLKAREPDFYGYYAEWLHLSGRELQAVEIQQKQIRLLQSLGLHTRVTTSSEVLIQLSSDSVLADISQDAPTIDLQPKYINSVPIPGLPARPVFTLSNLRDHPVEVLFSLSGDSAYTAELEGSKMQIQLIPDIEGSYQETQLELASFEQLLIQVIAPISLIGEAGSQFVLHASVPSGSEQTAMLSLGLDTAMVDSAIIDAVEILSNPFYWVPVFHDLAANVDAENPKSIALRAQASHPTRIEVYDSEGRLLFVDAMGDGRFDGAGDLISTGQVYQDYPVLLLDQPNQMLEFRYQPMDPHLEETIHIRIERAQITGDSALEWIMDVEDHIRFDSSK